jgi:hypothetical protein
MSSILIRQYLQYHTGHKIELVKCDITKSAFVCIDCNEELLNTDIFRTLDCPNQGNCNKEWIVVCNGPDLRHGKMFCSATNKQINEYIKNQ